MFLQSLLLGDRSRARDRRREEVYRYVCATEEFVTSPNSVLFIMALQRGSKKP